MIIRSQTGNFRQFSIFGAQMRVLLPREKTKVAEVIEEVWPAGGQAPLNAHDEMEQLYVILDGRASVVVGDEQGEVTAGDLVFIPRGATHAIQNSGAATLTYLCIDVFRAGLPPGEETWQDHERRIFETFGRASA